jgi:hypothetical protein
MAGEMPCKGEGRDRTTASASQGKPKIGRKPLDVTITRT